MDSSTDNTDNPQTRAKASLLQIILNASSEDLLLVVGALKLSIEPWGDCLCRGKADVLRWLDSQPAKTQPHHQRHVEFVIAENQRAKDRARDWTKKQAAFATQKRTAARMKKM